MVRYPVGGTRVEVITSADIGEYKDKEYGFVHKSGLNILIKLEKYINQTKKEN